MTIDRFVLIAFAAAGCVVGAIWVFHWFFQAFTDRRDVRKRELLKRRLNHEIDHPVTWDGDEAA